MKRLIPLLLLILTACGEGEFRIAPPVPAGGDSAPSRPADSRPLAPGPHKMLNDPEKEEWVTDEERILADTPDEAQRKCRQLAEERGLELQDIKPPSRSGGKRYVCKFGGYVER